MVADAIVPLCRKHHRLYDEHRLDLRPVLSDDEFMEAVRSVGYETAVQRITPACNPRIVR